MSAETKAPAAPLQDRHLFNATIDFLCLGGASLLILPLISVLPKEAYTGLWIASLVLANFINHPHFAHSYQIFYQDYATKIKGGVYPKALQYRYIFSGIFVPIILVAFFAFCISAGNAKLLGQGVNLMLFLVGWHYAKQGYGIMIVDSVYKKLFLTQTEKKIFLINAYANWLFFWICTNEFLSKQGEKFWGVSYYAFSIPKEFLYGFGALAAATTIATVIAFIKYWTKHKRIPLNGMTAYFTTIYMWLWLRLVPLAFLFVPFFHSLQYLVVVWRYEMNAASGPEVTKKFRQFLAAGFLLGLLGFWIIPIPLNALPYDKAVFGSALFVFIFWIFINVHHYFMDNVIWRRENPSTKKYLFG
jgi:hypothetical protein